MSRRLRGGCSPKAAEQRRLHLGLVDVEGAHLVPTAGLGGEILRRLLLARGAHGGQALAIERQIRIIRRQHAAEAACQARPGSRAGAPVEHPAAFAKAFEQAGVGEQLEVPRDARLALPEHLRELRHGPLALGADREQTQATGIRGGAQTDQERVEGIGLGVGISSRSRR